MSKKVSKAIKVKDLHNYEGDEFAVVWSDGECDMPELEKILAKKKKRIVELTDVTCTKQSLMNAVRKSAKIPGNEIPAFVEFLLKEIIMA